MDGGWWVSAAAAASQRVVPDILLIKSRSLSSAFYEIALIGDVSRARARFLIFLGVERAGEH